MTTYEIANIPGRSTGFNLGAGYTVTYGYEAGTGRFRSVDWSAGGQTGNAVYVYLNNSDLFEQLTVIYHNMVILFAELLVERFRAIF